MRNIILVFLSLTTQVSAGQDCNTSAANKASVSARGQDVFVSAASGTANRANAITMKPFLAKAESWIKNKLTGFTGAKLHYSNDFYVDYENGGGYTENFYKATGIKGAYCAKMRFYAYYCYDNNNTIYTEVESGSFINVNFNNVFISPLCMDVGVYTVNEVPVFRIFKKSRTEGRIDFYEQRAKSTEADTIYTSKNDMIIIRNSDKPVFITVSRKEYLQQMLKDIEIYKARNKGFATEAYASNLKILETGIAAQKTYNKNYTAEKEVLERKRFSEDNNPEKLAKQLQTLDDEVIIARQVINQYLGKPTEWLNRNFSDFYPYSTYEARSLTTYFDGLDNSTESKDNTGTEIVSLNAGYYNKNLKIEVPQLIMVHLSKGHYPHMLKVERLVKQPGALAPLEAMLNPGKSSIPEIVLPELTSTYTLKYLPKLTTLTPLKVPAGMPPSTVPVSNDYNGSAPVAKLTIEIPTLSPKLGQIPKLLTVESYKTYIQQLYTSISTRIKQEEKSKVDNYLKAKQLTQSKDISNTAFAAWLQNAPAASLYLYSKAVMTDPLNALVANNFSAFLLMGGLPEKSIPILEFWNKQKPGEATLLCNLGNAYYRLGDIDKAMNYLQQCVQHDTLNPTANKILCIMYLKKGDTKKAAEHGTKSITTSYDEQVTIILRQLNNKVKPGEIMSRLQKKEFPLLKRTILPALPSKLDEMEKFSIDFQAEKESLSKTIDDIEAKMPAVSDDSLQKLMMAGLTHGISSLQVKAQFIIMDAMQTYQRQSVSESDAFRYNLKNLAAPYTTTCKAIDKKYTAQLNKLEGGEAGDEDQIAALELAKCKEINAETEKYLAGLSPLVNEYAQRQEFIARKFYRDYANWAPYWMKGTNNSFPSIERDYLKAVSNIFSEYRIVTKSNCTFFEPLPKKDGALKKWEEAYCANMTGKLGMGPLTVTASCNSWGISGGEGIVGSIQFNYADDGSFEDFIVSGGLGTSLNLGGSGLAHIAAGASVTEFLKVGRGKISGKWEVKDFGINSEVSMEVGVGVVNTEVKIIDVSVAVNAGLEVGGVVPSVINLDPL